MRKLKLLLLKKNETDEIKIFGIHVVRSLFHLACFVTGLVYSFAQPRFLNVDVWSFVFMLSGLALTIDAFVFAFFKKIKKAWPFVYILDALFSALLMYQTGQTFFAFLFLMWLFSVTSAGVQFSIRAVVLQGLFCSFLLTWLVLLAPAFREFQNHPLFLLNNALLFGAGLSGAFFGPYLSSLIRPIAQSLKRGREALAFQNALDSLKDIMKLSPGEKAPPWMNSLKEEVENLEKISKKAR